MRRTPVEKPVINAVDIELMSLEQQGYKLIKTLDGFLVQIQELQKRHDQYATKLVKIEKDLEKLGKPASWLIKEEKNA